jgi:hypothetical protein
VTKPIHGWNGQFAMRAGEFAQRYGERFDPPALLLDRSEFGPYLQSFPSHNQAKGDK